MSCFCCFQETKLFLQRSQPTDTPEHCSNLCHFVKGQLLWQAVKPLTEVTPLSVATTVKVSEKPLSVVITVICITSSREGLITEVDPN